MITPKLKDEILSLLIKDGPNWAFKTTEAAADLNLDRDILEIILKQFEEMGLMSIERTITDSVTIRLTANAFDLQRLGGFTGREELLKLNLQKLKMEVDALKNSFPKKAERITTILSNIASIVPMLMK